MHISTSLVDFNWWSLALSEYVLHPFIMVILCLLSVFVVVGNLLVISAIWHENQLHSVTNYLIASLAAADCLVGAVVMPFSIISEIIIGSWTFGATWCDLWHSFDVLASTASIMNLCAISLDRYLAITKPISYPTRMTPKRVALLIVSLWTCSSLISFPAILWWRAVGPSPLQQFSPPPSSLLPSTSLEATISPVDISPTIRNLPDNINNIDSEVLLYRCVFTDDTYYLLFSSFISFYGPLCVMLYAYYRIYKAAVQQTRFLKHGSKQVMVGGKNKKKKRSRHITENSTHSANEKNGLNEALCDGMSNMESYDRQHLVLRAHRGGGGGSSVVSSKAINGDMNNANKSLVNDNYHHQQKKRDNHTSDHTATSKRLSMEAEQDTTPSNRSQAKRGEAHTASPLPHSSDDLDQSILSKNDCPPHLSKEPFLARVHQGPNRNDRNIDLTSSKRDKLRVNSQRFDTSPLDDSLRPDIRSNSNIKPINSGSNDSASGLTADTETGEKLTETLIRQNESRQVSRTKGNNFMQYKQQKGKPLLASMNNRSTSVDVSIINHSPLSDISVEQSQTFSVLSSSSPHIRNSNSKRSQNYQRDSNYVNRSHKGVGAGGSSSVENKVGYGCAMDDNDEEMSDDIIESESISTSSGSYGTGSIVSVMARPQQNQKQNTDQMRSHVKDCCDTSDSRSVNGKLRRASSFGEPRYKESALKHMNIDEDGYEQTFLTTSGTTTLTNLDGAKVDGRRNKHRASCGGGVNPSFYIVGSDGITGFKTAKTLNIRSWVKLPRTRPRKNNDNNQQQADGLIKPPLSLLPLMMMNSDTSTDSSIVGTITQIDGKQVEGGDNNSNNGNNNRKKITAYDFDIADIRTKFNRDTDADMANENSSRHTIGMKRADNMLKDKNLSFKEDLERGERRGGSGGKGQMLYYDSDKLIQSIVDLTDIHYIDSTNQSSDSPGRTIECAADTGNRVTKVNLDPSEQVQLSDSVRTNMPRQHRSMGKKLSKLAKERKAAKTLGIVVGVFILCWLPFFVVNILVALCGTSCIWKPQILVSIVTWLGWLNSAMNPVIYACWSRDFRRAFRRVLCTWVEFVCPYDGFNLAKKLKLKKCSNYSAQEAYLSRNVSSIKGNTSSATIRSGMSIEGTRGYSSVNGGVSRSLLSDQ